MAQTLDRPPQQVPPGPPAPIDWRAEYAYTTGMQAFIYGFPYIYNAKLRHDWVTNKRDPDVVPYAAVNHFWHAARAAGCDLPGWWLPEQRHSVLAGVAGSGRRAGHLVPPGHGRPLLHLRADGVHLRQLRLCRAAHHRQRSGAFRHRAGRAGRESCRPGCRRWHRRRPRGSWCLGAPWSTATRTCASAHALQAAVPAHPAEPVGQAPMPRCRSAATSTRRPRRPRIRWGRGRRSTRCWPRTRRRRITPLVLDQFARIGIGPGLDVDAQPEAVKQGLTRAATIGMGLLQQQFLSGDWATIVNGWRYPPAEEGRFGDDFLQRAADQSLAGITANDPAEAVYLVNFDDADGAKLSRRGPLPAALRRRRPAPGGRVLVTGRLHRSRHEPDPQPRPPLLGRRPDPRAEAGPRRRADHPPAARAHPARSGSRTGCPPPPSTLVRDPADVPAPSRRDPGHVGVPRHHPAHLTTRPHMGASHAPPGADEGAELVARARRAGRSASRSGSQLASRCGARRHLQAPTGDEHR